MAKINKELLWGLSLAVVLTGCSNDGSSCCSHKHGHDAHEHHVQHEQTATETIENQEEETVTTKEKVMQTTPSGLGFEIIEQAPEGAASAQKGQVVTVHYTGWLQDANGQKGEKFDSSLDRGMPFSFSLGRGQVIKGWDEGVAMMKVGEKRRLIIPSDLGYGDRGFPGAIPGGATLIFDVELLDVA